MEFKEFTSPESKDYDVESSLNIKEGIYGDEITITPVQQQFIDLWCDLGLPEVDELEPYGITEKEFNNPNMSTIKKLKKYGEEKGKRR